VFRNHVGSSSYIPWDEDQPLVMALLLVRRAREAESHEQISLKMDRNFRTPHFLVCDQEMHVRDRGVSESSSHTKPPQR